MSEDAGSWTHSGARRDRRRGSSRPAVPLPGLPLDGAARALAGRCCCCRAGRRPRPGRSSARTPSRASDGDLTRQYDGEPLGERIVVTGRVPDRTAGRSATRWSRSGRRTPPAATRTTVDQHDAPLDPNFPGAGRCLTDDDGPLPLRHDQARRVPLGEPRERLAPGAHPLLALRARLHRPPDHPDVLPGRPAVRPTTRSSSRCATRATGSGSSRRSTRTTTTPVWALGYRFDIVVGATPTE